MRDPFERIEELKRQLLELEPRLPGRLGKQWTVCGKKGCRCIATKNPHRHGPYNQLSYTVNRKSSTMFIKEADVEEVQSRIAACGAFRQICGELILAWVDAARTYGFDDKLKQPPGGDKAGKTETRNACGGRRAAPRQE